MNAYALYLPSTRRLRPLAFRFLRVPERRDVLPGEGNQGGWQSGFESTTTPSGPTLRSVTGHQRLPVNEFGLLRSGNRYAPPNNPTATLNSRKQVRYTGIRVGTKDWGRPHLERRNRRVRTTLHTTRTTLSDFHQTRVAGSRRRRLSCSISRMTKPIPRPMK